MEEHKLNWFFLVGNLKIRSATMCYELEAFLFNLNYNFDKVSEDINV